MVPIVVLALPSQKLPTKSCKVFWKSEHLYLHHDDIEIA